MSVHARVWGARVAAVVVVCWTLIGLLAHRAVAAPVAGQVILFNCNSSDDGGAGAFLSVCTVSPSGGVVQTIFDLHKTGQARIVVGVTGNGATYAYADTSDPFENSTIFETAVGGGPSREVLASAGFAPVMSADGRYVLSSAPLNVGGVQQVTPVFRYDLSAGVEAPPTTIDERSSASSGPGIGQTFLFGWSGDTPLVTHGYQSAPESPAGLPSWLCVIHQPLASECPPSAALIRESSSLLSYPAGSPDGSKIAAVVGPSWSSGGALVLFNARTGAQIRTLDAGRDYQPQFSPDGSQIVFWRPRSSGTHGVYVVNVDGTGLHRVASNGTDPFWAATTQAVPPPNVAPIVSVVGRVTRAHALVVTGELQAGRTTVTATASRATARALHLKTSPHVRAVVVARASVTFAKAGHHTIKVKLPPAVLRAIHRRASTRMTIRVTTKAPGRRARTITRTLTLHR